jgi:hypothetical protein
MSLEEIKMNFWKKLIICVVILIERTDKKITEKDIEDKESI